MPLAPIMIGLFLTSISLFTYQVTLTRVFSPILRYHFVFLVTSMAIFGLGIAIASSLWVITARLKLPRLFFFSMIGSFAVWPHHSIPTFVGALIGLRLMKTYGKVKMKAYGFFRRS